MLPLTYLFGSPVGGVIAPAAEGFEIGFADIVGLESYFEHGVVVAESHKLDTGFFEVCFGYGKP